MIVIGTIAFIATILGLLFLVNHGQSQNYQEPRLEKRKRMIWDLIDSHSFWSNIEDGKQETRYEGYERIDRIFNRTGKW